MWGFEEGGRPRLREDVFSNNPQCPFIFAHVSITAAMAVLAIRMVPGETKEEHHRTVVATDTPQMFFLLEVTHKALHLLDNCMAAIHVFSCGHTL